MSGLDDAFKIVCDERDSASAEAAKLRGELETAKAEIAASLPTGTQPGMR